MADAEKWASGISVPPYAIDDQTAIQVTDGTVELVPGGCSCFAIASGGWFIQNARKCGERGTGAPGVAPPHR
jgi:hypothetical protein